MSNETFKVRDLRIKEKFWLDDAYLNGYARHLKPIATAVYMSLCRHADKGQSCFPAEITIAEEHGIGERTVRSKIALLQNWNIIKIKRTRSQKGTWLHNTYFLLDKSQWKKPQAKSASGSSTGKKEQNQRQPLPPNDPPLKVSHHIGLKSQPRRKDITFKNELYIPVLEEYQRLKGITLQGKEFEPIRQGIKTMFMSGRTPEQVIAAMRDVAKRDYCDWTINTVKMKLPEIISKLGLSPQINREQNELEKRLTAMNEGDGQNEQ